MKDLDSLIVIIAIYMGVSLTSNSFGMYKESRINALYGNYYTAPFLNDISIGDDPVYISRDKFMERKNIKRLCMSVAQINPAATRNI